MLAKIIEAFNKKKAKDTSRIVFTPEIKVKREDDTLYINMLRMNANEVLVAMVEVHNGKAGDKAPLPVATLSETAQKAILIRLTA